LSNGLLIIVISSLAEVASSKAIEYCRKEGDFHEWGSPKNQGDRTDLQSIKRALESNSSIKTLLDSDLEINSHGLRLAERLLRYSGHTPEITNGRLYGSGKDRYRQERTAVSLLPDAYFKSNGGG